MVAKTQSVALALPQEATLGHVFSALAEQLPVLVGRVSDSAGLLSGYTCNINGLDFVRLPSTPIHSEETRFCFFPRMRVEAER